MGTSPQPGSSVQLSSWGSCAHSDQHHSHLWSLAPAAPLTSHQSHPGAGEAFLPPPLPGTSFPTGGMNCNVAVPSHNPGCLSKGDKSSSTVSSFQKQTSRVTFHAREVMIARPGLQSCRFQLPDIEEVIANSPGKRSCSFHVWRLHSECQLSQCHTCQPRPVGKQGWANSNGTHMALAVPDARDLAAAPEPLAGRRLA